MIGARQCSIAAGPYSSLSSHYTTARTVVGREIDLRGVALQGQADVAPVCESEYATPRGPARVTRILQSIIPPDLALYTREVDAPVAPFQSAARDVRGRPRARRRGRRCYGARQARRGRRLVGGRRHCPTLSSRRSKRRYRVDGLEGVLSFPVLVFARTCSGCDVGSVRRQALRQSKPNASPRGSAISGA